MFFPSKKTIFFTILILLLSGVVNAKLAETTLSDFLNESEVILVASVIKINRDSTVPEYTLLEVRDVLKGSFLNREIKIGYRNEIHDQRIREKGLRLLFLKKKDNGTYTEK